MIPLAKKYWFIVAVSLVLLAILIANAIAAQNASAHSPDMLKEVHITPVLGINGSVQAFIVKATFHVIEAPPSGQIDSRVVGSVELDLAKSGGTVVLDGEQFEDREVMDALVAVLKREWSKANPSPLPQRRRSLRTSGR